MKFVFTLVLALTMMNNVANAGEKYPDWLQFMVNEGMLKCVYNERNDPVTPYVFRMRINPNGTWDYGHVRGPLYHGKWVFQKGVFTFITTHKPDKVFTNPRLVTHKGRRFIRFDDYWERNARCGPKWWR